MNHSSHAGRPDPRRLSRRRFIGEMSCASVGLSSLLSSLLTLRLTGSVSEATLPVSANDDYKAMICLFFAGGNDSFNMLVPRQEDAYAEYAATRDVIALPRESLLPITSAGQAFSEFGIHPRLTGLQQLYNDGKLAFVANLGTLIEPITREQYQPDKSPRGLFSHSDQQFHWQTVVPQIRGASPGGWAGRVADVLDSANLSGKLAMNISLSGNNVFQSGNNAVAYSVSSSGAPEIEAFRDPVERLAITNLLEQNYQNLYQRAWAGRIKNAFETTELFDQSVGSIALATEFPDTSTGRNLEMIARIIAARDGLEARRQIFFLLRGGWDHHSEVLNNQDALFTEIDAAISAFWAALTELGMANQVVLFTASDFGRTLTTNGLGSDHAWGGNHFALGGPVHGGKIYGSYPSLAINSELDIGRGRLIPTTSVDLYAAELASWFGVPSGELDTVLPNLRNFIDPYQSPYPVGFLG